VEDPVGEPRAGRVEAAEHRREVLEHIGEVLDVLRAVQRQPCRYTTRLLALSQSVWARKCGEPGVFSAPKLTGLYRKPRMAT
jgi:hypothetical protein